MDLRFLTDENISASLVFALREKGYSVFDIKEEGLFGTSDKEVLEKANSNNRIILTHDKDFIKLAERFITKNCSVIVIRYSDKSPENIIKRFIPLLETPFRDKLFGSLIIINDNTIKIDYVKIN